MSNLQLNKPAKILLAGLKNLRQVLTDLSLDQFVVNTLETLMYLDREEHLKSLKASGVRDKGNGTYARAFKSLSKSGIMINIPRTRYTEFKPLVLEFLKHTQERIYELVLLLYSKGLTTRDVSDIFKNFFGEEISYSQVSNLAERFHELRQSWEKTRLESSYKVVYGDALYITLRRGDSYAKEAVHIMYGIREDNKRELLSLSVNPTESKESWSKDLASLKQRGVKKIDLIVTDGLKGLEDEVHKHFPGTLFQKCVLHKIRKIMYRIRPKDKARVIADLKQVFDHFDHTTSSIEEGLARLSRFVDQWKGSYPFIKNCFTENTLEYYFTYLKFSPKFRRMIYTTNSIESLNKKIRKATKNKQSFEKPDRLLDYIFVVIKDFEANNWMQYPVSSFAGWTQETPLT